MAINLGNLFQGGIINNTNNSNITNQLNDVAQAATTQDTSALKQAVEQLKNMMVGDIFSGQIADVQDNKVALLLGGGQQLTATLQNQVEMVKGQQLMFQVEANANNQVALKVLDQNSQEMLMMNKALSEAGMAVNDTTINLVKNLLDNNMPIDKQTLNAMSRQLLKFPDASVDTIARMTKLQIPITESNITQFEAYRNYEHQITGNLNQIVEDFSGMMAELANTGESSAKALEGLSLFNDMTQILSENESLIPDDVAKNLAKEMLSEDLPQSVQNLAQKVGTQPMSPKEFSAELLEIARKEDFPKESLSKMITSESFSKLFASVVKKELLLNPEEMGKKEEVKEFYSRLYEKTNALSQLLEKGPEQAQNLAKSVSNVRDNVNFMNDLSQNMTFMQFPVQLPNGQAQGDLYVYTNKKSLREHPDNISALLHLDMDNLGPMDILVKMNGKNVSTNFCLESEEMLDFICEHIDELNERIDKLGLNFKFTMNVKEEKQEGEAPVRFTEDFLDQADPLIAVKSFVFDTKA